MLKSCVIPKPRAFTSRARACSERSRGGSGGLHFKGSLLVFLDRSSGNPRTHPRIERDLFMESPKTKKRPVTLSSHETPEQPSPRTAQSQGMFSPLGCKFHVRASRWHEADMPLFCADSTSRSFSQTGYLQQHPEVVFGRHLAPRLPP